MTPPPQPQAPEPPAPRRGRWYGHQILIGAGITAPVFVTTLWVSAVDSESGPGDGWIALGSIALVGHVASGAAIHGAHHRSSFRSYLSPSIRLSGLVSGVVNGRLLQCEALGQCDDVELARAGLIVGAVLPPILEAFSMSWEEERGGGARIVPFVDTRGEAAVLGIAGRY